MKKCSASTDGFEQQNVVPVELQNCITFGGVTGGLAKTADSVSSSGRTPLLPLRASQTVGDWLDVLNMGSFAGAFEKEKVDMRALPLLSEADLIYLGVTNACQRRTLLSAARVLQQRPAAQELSKPKGAQSSAAKSLEEQEQAASMEAVHVLDSIVPDSEEDSDFADDRIAARLLPSRKKAKSSAGRLSKQTPSGRRSREAQTTVPASVEEEREQLERALALSLSSGGETWSHESQPRLLSSSDVPDAAQHASAKQLPQFSSGALGRVLATRSSRGRVSQNRSYSRQTEKRLLETLYPPSRHAGCDRPQQASHERNHSDEDRPAIDRSGWSFEGDAGMGKASCNRRTGNVREISTFPALLSKSSIGNRGSVERVPAERSLWAMARQSDAGQNLAAVENWGSAL
ncbi:g8971 [Coccomyxa elongata]